MEEKINRYITTHQEVYKREVAGSKTVTLFQEIFEVREHTHEIKVPCWVVYSAYDELVTLEAQEYFSNVEKAKIIILKNSYHFYYEENDYKYLRQQFVEFCEEMQ